MGVADEEKDVAIGKDGEAAIDAKMESPRADQAEVERLHTQEGIAIGKDGEAAVDAMLESDRVDQADEKKKPQLPPGDGWTQYEDAGELWYYYEGDLGKWWSTGSDLHEYHSDDEEDQAEVERRSFDLQQVHNESPAEEQMHKTECCIVFKGSFDIVVPNNCCSVKHQCFCLETLCNFPLVSEVPCMFTCCPFCVIFADWKFEPGFMETVSDLVPRIKASRNSEFEDLPPMKVTAGKKLIPKE